MQRYGEGRRRVLVTGAGSGLGRALSLEFAARRWQVACTDVDLAAAQQTLAAVQAHGGNGLAHALDVTSEAAFAEALHKVEADWGGLDVLINNAGVATAGTVADSPLDQWRWVLDINLLGCVRGARAVIPLMIEQGGGHIVNVASFAGIANPPALASYSAAKAAVISLSETLRFELHDQGIGVTVACPSFFKTNLLASGRSSAPQVQRLVARLMEKASVTAEDVARDIYLAVRRDRFLVISHADARQRARLKQLMPELYFRVARKATAAFLRS
jgi:NAD(P)-dependent dehydrogenase (short-subunit alcohol dehydrogenase family)